MQQILKILIIKAKIVKKIPTILSFSNGFCLGILSLLFALLYINNNHGLSTVIMPIAIVVMIIKFGFIYKEIWIK